MHSFPILVLLLASALCVAVQARGRQRHGRLPPFCRDQQQLASNQAVQACCDAIKAIGPPKRSSSSDAGGGQRSPPAPPQACIDCGDACLPPWARGRGGAGQGVQGVQAVGGVPGQSGGVPTGIGGVQGGFGSGIQGLGGVPIRSARGVRHSGSGEGGQGRIRGHQHVSGRSGERSRGVQGVLGRRQGHRGVPRRTARGLPIDSAGDIHSTFGGIQGSEEVSESLGGVPVRPWGRSSSSSSGTD